MPRSAESRSAQQPGDVPAHAWLPGEFGDETAEAGGRSPLVVRTMRRLLRDILAGVYAPGQRIREVEASERLQVSRATVREALRVLEQDGLIEIAPFKGARVIDPSPDEIADLFDLMATVYGAVARFAVRHAADAQLARFYADTAELEREARERRDIVHLIEIAYRMGAHLGECCGNALAVDMLRKLGRIAYLRHRYLQPVTSRWIQQSVTRVRRLEAALRARSEARSENAGRRLIQHTATLVLRHARDQQAAIAARHDR